MGKGAGLMISRKTGTTILAGAVLMIAGVIVTSMLLATKPSIIQINDGSFKILELPYTYTKNDAYVLVIGSAVGGMMLSYILTNLFASGKSEVKSMIIEEKPAEIPVHNTDIKAIVEHVKDDSQLIDAVLTALEGDEKKLVKEIADHDGEMLQNELVLSLNFSKAKVSRMLTDLEKRGLVVKKQYGLTNKIALADKLRGEKNEK
ncbi:MAG: MarR family transcriptional regulator [Candidatus Methanoperedens sp.]|nr:MarR family transcriptional regulator [Candidatus Methanoperedens sp.]